MCDVPAKEDRPGAYTRWTAAADKLVASLLEQAACRRQAYRGREQAAAPADEVKSEYAKWASASEKRQALFLCSVPHEIGKSESFEKIMSFLGPLMWLLSSREMEGQFEKTISLRCRFSASDVAVKRMSDIRNLFEFGIEKTPLDVAVRE